MVSGSTDYPKLRMIAGNIFFGPSGPEYRMERLPPILPHRTRIGVENGNARILHDETDAEPDVFPPRLWAKHDSGEIHFMRGDNEVLFALSCDRAQDFARQILNSVYEVETAQRYRQNERPAAPRRL
jgi:hypothetical protein